MSSNGRLKQSELGHIGNGLYLRKDAARAFNQLNAKVKKRFGRGLGVVSAYRPYAKQQYLWNLYLSGRGNLAARPGTSNHGLGLAVDLDLWSRQAIDKMGAPYGFSKKWSDAPSEYWHIVFSPAHYNPPKAPESIYKHLTQEERKLVASLRSARKKAKSSGGWEKNPELLKQAVDAKKELKDRIRLLKGLDLNKLNRRTRLNVLEKVVKDD